MDTAATANVASIMYNLELVKRNPSIYGTVQILTSGVKAKNLNLPQIF